MPTTAKKINNNKNERPKPVTLLLTKAEFNSVNLDITGPFVSRTNLSDGNGADGTMRSSKESIENIEIDGELTRDGNVILRITVLLGAEKIILKVLNIVEDKESALTPKYATNFKGIA